MQNKKSHTGYERQDKGNDRICNQFNKNWPNDTSFGLGNYRMPKTKKKWLLSLWWLCLVFTNVICQLDVLWPDYEAFHYKLLIQRFYGPRWKTKSLRERTRERALQTDQSCWDLTQPSITSQLSKPAMNSSAPYGRPPVTPWADTISLL